MFCTSCGHENPETGEFCKSCGASLNKESSDINARQGADAIIDGAPEQPDKRQKKSSNLPLIAGSAVSSSRFSC